MTADRHAAGLYATLGVVSLVALALAAVLVLGRTGLRTDRSPAAFDPDEPANAAGDPASPVATRSTQKSK